MSVYKHHIFVCLNERSPEDPKGCCKGLGSENLMEAFRSELIKRNLKGIVRANKAGCLDKCSWGPTVVIYPEAVWYGKVQAQDVPEIVDAMLAGNSVERLLMNPK